MSRVKVEEANSGTKCQGDREKRKGEVEEAVMEQF